jgi:hypothetical protein
MGYFERWNFRKPIGKDIALYGAVLGWVGNEAERGRV